jgi:hypothetical protein
MKRACDPSIPEWSAIRKLSDANSVVTKSPMHSLSERITSENLTSQALQDYFW